MSIMPTSQNGYRANDRSVIETFTIPGTTRRVSLRQGAPGELLVHWAAWFNTNIEAVGTGQLDDWGFAERTIRGSSTTLSNHASGTAIDLNATRHPLGKTGTFTTSQYRKIRAELAKYEGAIRWGGDYHGRKDEMHFEIMASPARCWQVLAKLTTQPAPVIPPPPAKVTPPANHVTAGWALVREGVAELRKTPVARKAIHARADELAAIVKKGPSK